MKNKMHEFMSDRTILRSKGILEKKNNDELNDAFLYVIGDYALNTIIKDKCIPQNRSQIREFLYDAVTSAIMEYLEKKPDNYTSEICMDILMNNKSQLDTVCFISGFDPNCLGDHECILPAITKSMFVKMARRKMETIYGMNLEKGYLNSSFGRPEYFSLLNEYQGVVGFVKYKPNNARYSDHLAIHVNDAVWRMNNYEWYSGINLRKFVVIGEGYNACRMYDATYGDILSSQNVALHLLSREKGLRKLN